MSFNAGAIIGTLGLDTNEFTQGMLQAEGIASLFPHALTEFIANPILGVIEVAKEMASAFKETFLEIARDADNMGELAEKAGVSVEFLTSVGKVAADSGSSVEGLADAMKFLGKNVTDASANTDEGRKLAAVFAQLGVSAADLKSAMAGDLESVFFKLGDGIKGLGGGAEKTKFAMELLGRGGTEMIPTFNKGSEEIKAFAQEIADLGGAVTQHEAEIGDKWGTLETLTSAAFTGIKKAITEPLFEAFGADAASVTDTMKGFAETVRSGVAKAIEILKPLVSGLWDSFKGLGSVLGSTLGPALSLLVPVLKLVAEVLGTIFETVGKILGTIGGVIHGVTDALGITDSASSQSAGKAGGTSAAAGVVVENLNVTGVDVNTASSVMAAKIQPQVAEAQRAQTEQLKAAAANQRVSRAVRGK